MRQKLPIHESHVCKTAVHILFRLTYTHTHTHTRGGPYWGLSIVWRCYSSPPPPPPGLRITVVQVHRTVGPCQGRASLLIVTSSFSIVYVYSNEKVSIPVCIPKRKQIDSFPIKVAVKRFYNFIISAVILHNGENCWTINNSVIKLAFYRGTFLFGKSDECFILIHWKLDALILQRQA